MIVNPTFGGQVALGYKVTGYILTPLQVRVKQSGAKMPHITAVQTESIDLTDLKLTTTRKKRGSSSANRRRLQREMRCWLREGMRWMPS